MKKKYYVLHLLICLAASNGCEATSLSYNAISVGMGDTGIANVQLNGSMNFALSTFDTTHSKLSVNGQFSEANYIKTKHGLTNARHNKELLKSELAKKNSIPSNSRNIYKTMGQDIETAKKTAEFIYSLKKLDNQCVYGDGNLNFDFQFPIKNDLVANLGLHSIIAGNGYTFFNKNDVQRVLEMVVKGKLSSKDLKTGGEVVLLAISDVSFSAAKKIQSIYGDWSISFTAKAQRLDSYSHIGSAYEYNHRLLNDNAFKTHSTFFNYDVGVAKKINSMTIGLRGENLNCNQLKTAQNETIRINPRWGVGVNYEFEKSNFEIDYDINNAQIFISDNQHNPVSLRQQWIKAGWQYKADRFVNIQGGMKHDLKGSYQDAYTIGLSLKPTSTTSIDLAYQYSDKMENIFGLGINFII